MSIFKMTPKKFLGTVAMLSLMAACSSTVSNKGDFDECSADDPDCIADNEAIDIEKKFL